MSCQLLPLLWCYADTMDRTTNFAHSISVICNNPTYVTTNNVKPTNNKNKKLLDTWQTTKLPEASGTACHINCMSTGNLIVRTSSPLWRNSRILLGFAHITNTFPDRPSPARFRASPFTSCFNSVLDLDSYGSIHTRNSGGPETSIMYNCGQMLVAARSRGLCRFRLAMIRLLSQRKQPAWKLLIQQFQWLTTNFSVNSNPYTNLLNEMCVSVYNLMCVWLFG